MQIAIVGYGKMGKLITVLAEEKGYDIVLKTNSNLPFEKCNLKDVDVAIDFSTPETAFNNISHAIKNNIPIISGTTGWLEKLEEIKKLCTKYNGAFLYASNFSIGVNMFFKINTELAKLMQNKNYKTSISETHHLEKLDKPSGTAKTLSEDIHKELKITPNIISHRIEKKIGTHEIMYESAIDNIKIVHEAKSRDGFALGALKAAEWIRNKNGIFSMQDVLSI
ncbi:MAG: 4-hydroxy-tetrahydrodipicolinate reductase [Flavobacteriales bacterium]|tara:strand:- start:183 stop:851 length:669 start_codon:yes stop_codon:yes gene_type:complete